MISIRHFIMFVLATISFMQLNAQNLVPNGDFEEGTKCQTNYEKPTIPKPWKVTGTPDFYMDSCELISPSTNVIGACELLSGKAIVGMVWDLPSKQNHYWVERLRTMLTQPLVRDSLYQLSMFINLGAYSPSSITQMSVHIASTISNHFTPPNELVTIDIPQPFISGTWVHLVDTFKAVGGERHLVIGNYLEPDNFVKLRKSKPKNFKCYIFIDSVSLVPVYPKLIVPTVEPVKNDTVILAGVNFNTNEATLLPEAYPTLQTLQESLPEDGFELLIVGHTDSIGNYENNITLSENRALSVAQYFISNGIDEHSITTEGKGPQSPIAPNNTEDGRAINRRVEIIIKRQ